MSEADPPPDKPPKKKLVFRKLLKCGYCGTTAVSRQGEVAMERLTTLPYRFKCVRCKRVTTLGYDSFRQLPDAEPVEDLTRSV